MPFLGHSSNYVDSKESSGGKKWIKTPTGWKPIEQTGEAGKTETELEETEVNSKNDEREEVNKILGSSFVKCIKRRQGTSRESSSYISIGQAMQQMHMNVACGDSRYHLFVLQVARLLFHITVYPCLSGSAQIYLVTTMDALINTVIKSDENCSEVISCANGVMLNLKQVCNSPVSLHSKKRAQIHLKKIERGKAAILEHLEEKYAVRSSLHVFTLPNDCLRQVFVCLKNPADIIHFGMTCRKTWSMVNDSRLWTHVMRTYSPQYYSQILGSRPKLQLTTEEAIKMYRQWYREVHLKCADSQQPLLLCSLCEFIYWKGSSHPCIVRPRRLGPPPVQINSTPTPVSPQDFINMFL